MYPSRVLSSRRRHIAAALIAVSVATSTITPAMLPVAVAASTEHPDISNSNGVKVSDPQIFAVKSGDEVPAPTDKPLRGSYQLHTTVSGKSASKGDRIYLWVYSPDNELVKKSDSIRSAAAAKKLFDGKQKLLFNGGSDAGAEMWVEDNGPSGGSQYVVEFLKDIDDFSFDVAMRVLADETVFYDEGEKFEPKFADSLVKLMVGEGDSARVVPTSYTARVDTYEQVEHEPEVEPPSGWCSMDDPTLKADRSILTMGMKLRTFVNPTDQPKTAIYYHDIDNGFRPMMGTEYKSLLDRYHGKYMGTTYDNVPMPGDVESFTNKNLPGDSRGKMYVWFINDKDSRSDIHYRYITLDELKPQLVVNGDRIGVTYRINLSPHTAVTLSGDVQFIAPYRGKQTYHGRCFARLVDPDEADSIKPLSLIETHDYGIYPLTSHQLEIPNLIYGSERISKGPVGATENNPHYDPGTVRRTRSITMTPVNDVFLDGNETRKPFPSDAVWSVMPGAPSWVTIDKSTGVLTAKPPLDADLDAHEFAVKMTAADGSIIIVPAKVTVKDLAGAFDPSGRTGSVQQTKTLVLDPPEGLDDAGKVTIAPKDALPDFITVAKDGRLTAKPTVATAVKTYTIPLIVTYADGSTDEIADTVTVKKIGANKINDFTYLGDGFSVEQGSTAKGAAAQINPSGIPAGTTFTKKSGPEWARVNSHDGVVTAAPGRDIDPAQYPVIVTAVYPDKTTDEAATLVTVTRRATDAETNRFGYPNGSLTAPQGGTDSTVAPTGVLPGTTYKVKPGTPSFVTVDKKTGVVTMKPGAKEKLGKHPVTVIATYPDGSTEEATVVATVTPRITDADTHAVVYPDSSIAAPQGGTDATVPPTGTIPGTVFTLPKGTPKFITIDKSTGVVTMKPSKTEKLGKYPVVATATYPDKSTDTVTVVATVTPRDTDADTHDFAYPDNQLPVTQGETKSTIAPTGLVPGATAAITKGGVDWLSVDPSTGVVTASPTLKTKPGDYPVEVTVTYPDGSTDTAVVVVHVKPKPQADTHEPSYTPVTVKQGETENVTKPSGVPGDATVTSTGGAPVWVTVNPDGSMVARPGLDVTLGEYTVPVTVTYADGSTDSATETITVTAGDQAKTSNPMFPDALKPITVPQGGAVTTPRPDGLPDGATCTAGADTPDYVTVHEDCSITAAPGFDAEVGDHGFDVTITYPDGSTDTKRTHVNVTETSMADRYTPSLVNAHLMQGGSITVPVTFDGRGGTPVGATFRTVRANPLRSTVDDKGVVSTTAWYADTEAVTRSETEKDYPLAVEVTYADGSSEVVEAKTIVSPGPMLDYDLAYVSPIELFAGQSDHGKAPELTDKTKMEYQSTRTTFELGDRTESRNALIEKYGDGNVSIDPDTGVVSFAAGRAMEPQTITIPVTVRFDDGTFREIAQTVVIKPEAGLSSQLSSGNLTPSGSSDLAGIVGAVIGLGALAAIIGQLLHMFAPGAPVVEGGAPAPVPAPVPVVNDDPNVVVHADGTVCPANDHVKGVCRRP